MKSLITILKPGVNAYTRTTSPTSMHAFKKFKDTKEAVKTVNKLMEGKLTKKATKFLQNAISDEVQERIAVQEKSLAKAITEKLGIECETGSKYRELARGIRH